MRRYFILTMAVAGLTLALYFSICLFLPSPIAAEYWMAETVAVKRGIVHAILPPRILVLGGSSTLFSVDARQIEGETGMPAVNLGMHAAMRLDRMLWTGEELAKDGDTLVLILEVGYYGCGQSKWADWQLRNALAWDRSYFNGLPLAERIEAIFTAGGPGLMFEILGDRIGSMLAPSRYAERLRAQEPPDLIWRRFQSGALRTGEFGYSAYNLDDRGDMLNNRGAPYAGPGVGAGQPGGICPETLAVLREFVTRMHGRGVKVFFAHTPYLTETAPAPGWRDAEGAFSHDIASTGATLLDRREELFLPRADFFNTEYHLNELGRRKRTDAMIRDLGALGIGRTGARK